MAASSDLRHAGDAKSEAGVHACWDSGKEDSELASLFWGLFPQEGKRSGPLYWPQRWEQRGRRRAGGPAWWSVFCSWRSPGATIMLGSQPPREQVGPPPGPQERLRGLLSAGARFNGRPHDLPCWHLSTSAGMLLSGDCKQPTLSQDFPEAPRSPVLHA